MRWPDRSSFREPANYLLACLSEVGAPLLRGVSALRNLPPAQPPLAWRRALLLGAGHVGDVLYTTGSLPALRRGLPECALTYAAPPLSATVLEGNPNLAGTLAPADAMAHLPEFDAVICYNSSSSWRENVAAWWQGVPNRVGYVHKGFSSVVNHPAPIRRPQPYPAYFRDLVANLTGLRPDWSLRPQVYPTDAHEKEAAQCWSEQGLGAKPVVGCCLTSRQRTGVWPAEHSARCLRELHALVECDTILFGSAEDEPMLTALRDQFQLPSRIAAGRLSLLGLAGALRRCVAVVSTDSGPRHLANAVGTRVFFMPNFSAGKIETGRYLDTETDLAPAHGRSPAGEQQPFFEKIPPSQIAALVASGVAQ